MAYGLTAETYATNSELLWKWKKGKRAHWWLMILGTDGIQLWQDKRAPRMSCRVCPAEEVKYQSHRMGHWHSHGGAMPMWGGSHPQEVASGVPMCPTGARQKLQPFVIMCGRGLLERNSNSLSVTRENGFTHS